MRYFQPNGKASIG